MQSPDQSKNLIWAIGISMALLLVWDYLYLTPQREAQQAFYAKKQAAAQQEGATHSLPHTLQASRQTALDSDQAHAEVAPAEEASPRIPIETVALKGSIRLRGARFDDIILQRYQAEQKEESPPVTLFTHQEGTRHFAETGWLSATPNMAAPTANTLWTAQNPDATLTAQNPLILFWENPEGVRFEQHISLDKNYLFTITHKVINPTNATLALFPYGLIQRTKPEEEGSNMTYISYEGPLGVFGDVLEEIGYDNLDEDKKSPFSDQKGWLGFADKYWLSALIPDQKSGNAPFDAKFTAIQTSGSPSYQADLRMEAHTVAPGATTEMTLHLFAGAKKLELLDAYAQDFNIPLFDRALDLGWLYFFTKPLSLILLFFYSWLGNFGLAILLLTLVVKLLLFPLAQKSYRSMARMREVAPEIMAMRERYANDRMKINQEMMALYKRKQINPLAGCLPLLLQIPIFFALYKVLYVSIEMRHAPFYGWIHDLSAADPTNILNLFGLMPWDVPTWLPAIGVLPILFALSMVIQQKLSPPPTDPTQAMVMRWMPFVLLLILAAFPAGLVLYWTVSNLLSIIQQWWILRNMPKTEPNQR